MQLTLLRPYSIAAAAILLICSAAVLRDSAVPRAEDLLGLQQTGAGLHLSSVKWDIGKGRDARLSDQVHSWDRSTESLADAKGPGFVPATDTQQLAEVKGGARSLSKQMKTAVDTLRLSDFLTGVKPKVVQNQVQALDQKMDPHDTTGWMTRENVHRESPRQVQARRVKSYESQLQRELSTTKNQDSPKAKKERRELRELLKRKAAVKRSLDAAMRKEMHHVSKHVWTTRRVKAGDDADYLIHQIASPEDRHANYAKWLRSASGSKNSHHRHTKEVTKPHVTAGGQLVWHQNVHRQLQVKQARLQALSEDDTTHSRLQALSEDDNSVGASEIAMRQILGRAKKAAHTWADSEDAGDSHPQQDMRAGRKVADAGSELAPPHQQLAAKQSGVAAALNADLSDVEEGVSPQQDTPESIRQRAAQKVSRWMGGGYVDVYGR
jgi:hypothetical protein